MRNAASWDPSISSVVAHHDAPVGIGSKFDVTLGLGGRTISLTYRLVDLTTDSAILHADSALFSSRDIISISARDGGSYVRYEATLSGRGAAKLLEPFFQLAIDRVGRRATASLQEALNP
jgi:hypothetical protein